ncbi:MAG: hypothetical protein U5N56_07975 [Candidatus Marinimicrobia bacterium]|nr:hypothetical protein [Candidatus Neomarinimicrobiota bacterium]
MEQAIAKANDVNAMLRQNGFDPDKEMDNTLPHATGLDLPRVRIEIKDSGAHRLYIDWGESYDNANQREYYLPDNKLEGVIISNQRIRAFWKDGDTIPSCSSIDGIIRSENPVSSNCLKCPEAVVGEGNCKPKERLLLIAKIEGQIIPLLLALPPTSIKHFEAHKRRLMRSKLPLIAVNTVMSLTPVKKNGYNWGEILFSINGVADKEMLTVAKQARDQLRRFTEGIGSSDYSEAGDKAAD